MTQFEVHGTQQGTHSGEQVVVRNMVAVGGAIVKTPSEQPYPGGAATDVRLFTMADWAALQEDLAAPDTVMRALAWKYDMALRINIRDEWPARELVARRSRTTLLLRLMLNPVFVETRSRHYELHEQWMRHVLFRGERLLNHRVLRRYGTDEIRNVNVLTHDIESAIVANGFVPVRAT